MKAAIYCRLSKEDQDRATDTESESIQNQKSMLIEYALERGFEIYHIYSDEDYSGVDRARPDFNAMIAAASQHKFDVILAKTQSRFTRDMELVEKYLHGKFIEWGIRFIAVVDHVDTNDAGNKKSRQINGLINEWYLDDLSNNVRSVLLHKRREGKYIATFSLYGYQKDPLDKNHIIIDPEAAEVVRRIFSLYLEGNGVTRITRILNEENLPNPTLYKRQHGIHYVNTNAYGRGDGLWSRATIYAMLKNRTYAGDMVQGRHKKVSYKSAKTITLPKSQWIVVPNTHEPIIDKETFERVQKMQAQGFRGGKGGTIHPLAGLVRCGLCGMGMERCSGGWAKSAGGRLGYLRCRTRLRKGSACSQTSIRLDAVEKMVMERMQQHIDDWFNPDGVALSVLKAEQKKKSSAKRTEMKRLQQQIDQCSRATQNLYLDKSAGVIDSKQFVELKERFDADQKRHEKRIGQLQDELDRMQRTEQERDGWLNQIKEKAQAETLTRDLAVLLIHSITIGPKEGGTPARDIEIHWTF